MKRKYLFFLLILMSFLTGVKSQEIPKSEADELQDRKDIVCIIFPFEFSNIFDIRYNETLLIFQYSFINNFVRNGLYTIHPDSLKNRIKEMNLSIESLTMLERNQIGKSFNADVGVFGIIRKEYISISFDKKSDTKKLEIIITAIEFKTGKVVWEQSGKYRFDLVIGSESVANSISFSFISRLNKLFDLND